MRHSFYRRLWRTGQVIIPNLTKSLIWKMATQFKRDPFKILLISVSVIIPWIAVQIQLDMSQQLKMYSYSFNLTRKLQVDHREDLIIFTRIPKTATLTILNILDNLSKKNNFKMFQNTFGMPIKRDVGIIILSFSTIIWKDFISFKSTSTSIYKY